MIYTTNTKRELLVDAEDVERVSKLRWYARKDGSIRSTSRVFVSSNVSLASFIMRRYRTVFDHINRNTYDNRKSNLRECSHAQNMCNMSKRSNTKSQYKGVAWHKATGSWIAQIGFMNKRKHLGCFNSEIDAAKAYNKAAIELFKEFAALNPV